MIKTFFIFVFATFSLLMIPIQAIASVSLTVNIISHSLSNGAGKEVDVIILKRELEKLGHRVNLCDYYKVRSVPSADINLFLAQFKPEWYSRAKLNWFIPNAEFCTASPIDLHSFDLVLCKTEESLKIFQPICKQAYYLGFTSVDHYRPSLARKMDFSRYLHVAGKSRVKGTGAVIKAWSDNPSFPRLILLRHHTGTDFTIPENIKLINQRISTNSLLKLQNESGIHLCPSKTEGFGHYLMEAMSAGAVVITTDGPPMNEFIKDKRCLVTCHKTDKKRYATLYIANEKELAKTVKRLQQLSPEELKEIGKNNREEYLRRTAAFESNFEQLMHKTVDELYD